MARAGVGLGAYADQIRSGDDRMVVEKLNHTAQDDLIGVATRAPGRDQVAEQDGRRRLGDPRAAVERVTHPRPVAGGGILVELIKEKR